MAIFIGFGGPLGHGTKGNRKDRGGGTADGGHCSAIDYDVDSFGPSPMETPEAAAARVALAEGNEKRMAASKRFQVTPRTRQGGSGLYSSEDE
jgi:hypothetical protein